MTIIRRVTRSAAAALVLAQAACSAQRTPASERATVASAATAKLDGATLHRWLVGSVQRPNEIVANRYISTWIDQALLATAIDPANSLRDSATVDAVILPDAARGAVLLFWANRRTTLPMPTDAQVDSIANLDEVRVFQQLMIRIPAPGDSAAMIKARARASEMVRRVSGTADFAAVVRAESDDSISRPRDGFLPPVTREGIPGPIRDRVWTLRPGSVSPALLSEAGYHIFRRATRAESRPYLKAWLVPVLAQRDEARFQDSLMTARGVKVAPKAEAALRRIAIEPVVAVSDAPLVTWNGGELRPAAVRMWLMMLLPDNRRYLTDASDVVAQNYLIELARRQILLDVAAPTGPLTAEARRTLAKQYLEAVDSLRTELAHVVGTKTGSAAKATGMIDAAAAGQFATHPLPGALASVLRARYPVTIDTLVIKQIVRAALPEWNAKHPNDSTRGS